MDFDPKAVLKLLGIPAPAEGTIIAVLVAEPVPVDIPVSPDLYTIGIGTSWGLRSVGSSPIPPAALADALQKFADSVKAIESPPVVQIAEVTEPPKGDVN